MKKIIISFFILIASLSISPLRAEEELFFTYMGLTAGGGINRIAYRGWSSDTNTRVTRSVSGNFFSGGFLFDIFVRRFIGEFGLEYINNSNSGEHLSVQNMIYTAMAKYAYLRSGISLTCGLGLYLETPPSDRSYNGGGLNAAIGAVFDIGREWKIIFDVFSRYGRFGIGDDSSKLSWGAKIGAVYRVGRI